VPGEPVRDPDSSAHRAAPAILRTPDLIFKIGKVDKLIGLAPQFVGDHRRLRLQR
jgi:hypothetical protein